MKGLCLYLLFISLSLGVVACHSPTLEDYREEGRTTTRQLIKELQKIRTRDQLMASTGKLKKLFDQMSDQMIIAQQNHQKNPDQQIPELTKEDHDLSDALRFELNRLYHLEGGRAIIEKCQEHSLKKLQRVA